MKEGEKGTRDGQRGGRSGLGAAGLNVHVCLCLFLKQVRAASLAASLNLLSHPGSGRGGSVPLPGLAPSGPSSAGSSSLSGGMLGSV